MLNFNSTSNYTIASSDPVNNKLVMDTWGADAAINVTAGNPTISAPLVFNKNLTIASSASASLTVSGAITSGGTTPTLTITGAGNAALIGNLTSSGAVTVDAGFSGTVQFGNVVNNGGITNSGSGTVTFGNISSTNSGAITINGNGTVTFGNVATAVPSLTTAAAP